MSDTDHNCSFCGNDAKDVQLLIGGNGIFICEACIEVCNKTISSAEKTKTGKTIEVVGPPPIPTPREIRDFLDTHVIGQSRAKTALSVAVYNHYKRLRNPVIDGVEIQKSNILLVGPTGCGKTLLAESIARMLDVPFARGDATSLTEVGYVGADVESLVTRLLAAAGDDIAKAETGIIFIDEIDKLRTTTSTSGTRDVSGEGVQQGLLKMLEGADVMAPSSMGKKGPMAEMLKVNTRNILFILSGAFVGLEKLVGADDDIESKIGFTSKVGKEEADVGEILRKLAPPHLVKFGLIPEFVGRIPVLATLDALDENQLISVLTEPKNAIVRQMQAMFGLDEVELEFTPDALIEVAKKSMAQKTGARGLQNIIETALLELQFRLPEISKDGFGKIVLDASFVANGTEALFIERPPIDVTEVLKPDIGIS